MPHPNFDLIDKFFAAYGNHDLAALRQVLADDAAWVFPGRNRFSGTHRGAEAIMAPSLQRQSLNIHRNRNGSGCSEIILAEQGAYAGREPRVRTLFSDTIQEKQCRATLG